MIANRVLCNRILKCIFLTSIVICGIIVFLFDKESKNVLITWRGNSNQSDPTPFPHEIRNYWNVDGLDVAFYILSAIGSNTTNHVKYKRDIRLQGLLDSKDKNKRIKCCFIWTNGTISIYDNPEVMNMKRTELIATQIVCPFNSPQSDVSGVTVTSANSNCPSADDELYIKPSIPKKADTEESFAICLKIVYGNVDNTLFLDWLEFHRKIQVDKIFAFTYNLTETTNEIIGHYVHIGFMEARPFNKPNISQVMIGEKTIPYWEHEVVMLYDCLQRSSGYKYMAIVDMDEFLLPRIHGNIKELMKYLILKNPAAAGFQITSYIFDKNVTPNTRLLTNGSDIMRSFWRTRGLHNVPNNRKKNIVLPRRITSNGLKSHTYTPMPPFTRVNVSSSIVSINHYRTCYENLKQFCAGNLIEDREILRFVENRSKRRWYPKA